jgi:hypothetical protein
MLFIIIQCIQRFLGATGKAGNTLIHFRCVDPKDKSVAIGFSEFLMCGLAFIPGPIVFGYLIGTNLDQEIWYLFLKLSVTVLQTWPVLFGAAHVGQQATAGYTTWRN